MVEDPWQGRGKVAPAQAVVLYLALDNLTLPANDANNLCHERTSLNFLSPASHPKGKRLYPWLWFRRGNIRSTDSAKSLMDMTLLLATVQGAARVEVGD